jgi:hypothetical protein
MAELVSDGTWDEHFRGWSEVLRGPGQDEDERIQAARRRVAWNTPGDWQWLAEALADAERKWFVADVFESHPVPGRLLGPMLRAGVLERNPSFNRAFIEPCVRSLGARRVLEEGRDACALTERRLRTLAHSNAQFQLSLAASRFRHASSRFEVRGR